jgi:hypothetical protein
MAKQLSYDLSSAMAGYSPRQEGFVEECKIGEADLVDFKEPGFEEEEKEEKAKTPKSAPKVIEDVSEESSSCTSEESSEEDISATPSKSA